MATIRSGAFFLGIGLLMTHELDAVRHHEWRILPVTGWLSDAHGYQAFLLLHVPLFAVIVGLLASMNARIRAVAMTALAAFFIIHAALHRAYSGHALYEFESAVSNALIYGAALLGMVYLALAAMDRDGGGSAP